STASSPAPAGGRSFTTSWSTSFAAFVAGVFSPAGAPPPAPWAQATRWVRFGLVGTAIQGRLKTFAGTFDMRNFSPRTNHPQKAKTGLSGDSGRGVAEKIRPLSQKISQ